MKNLIILICLILSISTNAQTLVKMEAGRNSVAASIGYMVSNCSLSIGYVVPYRSTERPLLLQISIERRFKLTDINEDENKALYLIPAIGIAKGSWSDFSHYDEAHNYEIMQKTKCLPIYGLSLGATSNFGMWAASVKYCKEPFFALGVCAYIGRIK